MEGQEATRQEAVIAQPPGQVRVAQPVEAVAAQAARAEARGQGVGRALFKALAAEAQLRDCARIDWAVLDWNESAMGFYRAIGGRPQTGWQPWRIGPKGIEALAQ